MKKLFAILLVITLLMGVMSGVVLAEEVEDCAAAPAVANQILKSFDIESRYANGDYKKDRPLYSNYISEVAHEMGDEEVFPAYECDGTWDGITYVEKCDVEAYYRAVYNYLRFLGANIPINPSMLGSWVWSYANLLMVIDTQRDGEFSGLVGRDENNFAGYVEGTVDGNSITFTYTRGDYASNDDYYLIFTGVFEDCNTITGTWIHGNGDKEPRPGVFDLTIDRQ